MDSLTWTTSSSSLSINKSPICSFLSTTTRVASGSCTTRRRSLSCKRSGSSSIKKFVILASSKENDGPKLDKWDEMELKFGRLLGEDPKLTIAKIMGKKLNPDASYLEIEKSFYKKKGKMDIEEVPFDVSQERPFSDSSGGLNLVRPVPKKGVKFQTEDKSHSQEVVTQNRSVGNAVEKPRGSVPNVILRKPTVYSEDDIDMGKPSKLNIKRNLTLQMRNDQEKERFSDMTLLRKPMPKVAVSNIDDDTQESSGNREGKDKAIDITLLKKPVAMSTVTNLDESQESSDDKEMHSTEENVWSSSKSETPAIIPTLQRPSISLEPEDRSSSNKIKLADDSLLGKEVATDESSGKNSVNPSLKTSIQSGLLGKPKMLDQSVKATSNSPGITADIDTSERYGIAELEELMVAQPVQEREDADWTSVEYLAKTGGRAEVELVTSSTRGFVVSSGSLIGFLPYRNLTAKWKFLAFESWLREKGLDPSRYKQSLGVVGGYDAANKTLDTTSDPVIDPKIGGEVSPEMNLEDLLMIYDQEKLKFLSSFVGQRIKVNVLMAERKSRKLIFSIKPREKEELIEKKKNLMAKLSVGDVVKCCIKKITYFGIFVEVEGVPALIHQTEVSWDATLDPASYYKIGQIVEAKVYQLDFSLERIFLSLKEITPDPLTEALESVVGEHNPFPSDGNSEVAQPDAEWTDMESLIKELELIDGVQSVVKGRYFLSPGLTPTFQVYMASMFDNQYKLLARSGNKVQELIVEASLSKEDMKSAIFMCTNRVE